MLGATVLPAYAQEVVAETAPVPLFAPESEPAHGRAPWKARRRLGVVVAPLTARAPLADGSLSSRRLRALGLRADERSTIEITRWPPEPLAPATVVRRRFERALKRLCPADVPVDDVRQAARAALVASREYAVDPFLLGALVRHQSDCRAASEDSWGIGLTRVNPGMHRARIGPGGYRYGAPSHRGFASAALPLGNFPFTRKALKSAELNLHFAAAALKVFTLQCPAIDAPFGSAPHRHPVSHAIWGDHVRSALPEALVLTERRRLLGYYRGYTAPAASRHRGQSWSSPLDGPPRIAVGLLGDPREGGRRLHKGIDLRAVRGEPVRAVADGVVSFAGVDSRKHGFLALAPERGARAPASSMGPRGVFVRLEHAGGISSLYVHLADYVVETGQQVQRGELLGRVGLTGVHSSDAHLHFGLFDGEVTLDPLHYLGPLVLSNAATGLDVALLRRRLDQASRRP